MNDIKLIRKRYIPYEVKDISGDEILHLDDDLLVTRWNAIHPRDDIKGGISYGYLKKGWKISQIYDHNDKLIYYYCDIIEVDIDKENNIYTGTDLLLDVIVYPDGIVKVVDFDELAEAFEKKLIDEKQMIYALNRLDELLRIIYQNKFYELVSKYYIPKKEKHHKDSE